MKKMILLLFPFFVWGTVMKYSSIPSVPYNQMATTPKTYYYICDSINELTLENIFQGDRVYEKRNGGTYYIKNASALVATGTSAAGPAGPQGPAGLQGPQGSQGPIGLTGPMGATGLTGPIGPQGPAGPIGLTGLAGATGSQGPQGVQGPTGPTGLTGTNGTNGTNASSLLSQDANGDFMPNPTGTTDSYLQLDGNGDIEP